jgi:CubicO group peptidase (beta-lactamase class C family)
MQSMRQPFLLFILFCLPFVSWSQKGQDLEKVIESYRSFIRQQMEADRIPGLTVGFYKGDTMWTEGFGSIDLENDVKASDQSAYRLASNTKSMTAVAVLQLQEAGKLNIDDPVHKYVPYFPRKKWDITLRQLMGHLGGISHYKDYEVEGSIREDKDTRESLEIFDAFELVAKPGTEYHYTSYGYNLLGAAIEGASKQPYGKYLRENIWEPLGMDHTWMDDPDEIIPNRAQGYRLDYGELKNSEFVNISSRFASGGTVSTVVDLLKYGRGLNREQILTSRSTRMMETTMNTARGLRTDYGMGWRIEPVNGRFQAYHTGGQPETRTILMRFPTLDFAIALAYNLEGGSLRSIAHRLYQLIMDEGWNVMPYTGNQYDQALTKGMWDIYHYGLAYYDYHEKPRNTDTEDMKQMFQFLNNTLHPGKLRDNYEEVSRKISLGRHPKARTAYVRIGSYMAHQLVKKYGEERLDYYHKNGAPAFFSDYLKLSADEGNRWPVNEPMVRKISQYHDQWSETWNDQTRRLHIASWSDLSEKLDQLNRLSTGRQIYPDYTSLTSNALFERALSGKDQSVAQLAGRFIELYPESAIPYVSKGNIHIIRGEPQKAEELYKQALMADVDRHAVSAGLLNHYARRLFEANHLERALSLLEVASGIYPENGSLEDTRADIYREKSKRSYQKALELDPTLQDTWKNLKEIE